MSVLKVFKLGLGVGCLWGIWAHRHVAPAEPGRSVPRGPTWCAPSAISHPIINVGSRGSHALNEGVPVGDFLQFPSADCVQRGAAPLQAPHCEPNEVLTACLPSHCSRCPGKTLHHLLRQGQSASEHKIAGEQTHFIRSHGKHL